MVKYLLDTNILSLFQGSASLSAAACPDTPTNERRHLLDRSAGFPILVRRQEHWPDVG